MSTLEVDASSFFALLARQWPLDAQVLACRFDHAGRSAAFALADGTLAIASMDDAEAAGTRWRMSIENGCSSISPRARKVSPLTVLPADVAPVRLEAFGSAGFLAGGASGRLVRVTPDGLAQALVEIDSGEIDAICATHDEAALVAAGGIVSRYDPEGGTARAVARYETRLRVMAPSPGTARLAFGFDAGFTIVALDQEADDRLDFELGPVDALEWSPDGLSLAAGLQNGGIALVDIESRRILRLPDYPAPVRSLDWSADSQRLVTGGAFRPIVWVLGGERERPQTIETGRAGLVVIEVARLHPHRPLVAVGYENGMIVVTQVGRRDELIIRDPAPGGVRDLHWSPDGEHLAFYTAESCAGVVDLPAQIFK